MPRGIASRGGKRGDPATVVASQGSHTRSAASLPAHPPPAIPAATNSATLSSPSGRIDGAPGGVDPAATGKEDPSGGDPAAPTEIVVQVAGAVKQPGVYHLHAGARNDDAVKAAGGLSSTANAASVNLAARATDGAQLYVKSVKERPTGGVSEETAALPQSSSVPKKTLALASRGRSSTLGGTGASSNKPAKIKDPSEGKVNINTARADELQRLPNIGPAMAEKIIAYRQENHGFQKRGRPDAGEWHWCEEVREDCSSRQNSLIGGKTFMQTYGVGMIGFGFIGRVHAHAHLALPLFFDPAPAKTRLVGVCTTSEATGLKAAEQAGFAFHCTDYQALLERDDIQIIHICTPNDAHFAAVRDAIVAGKHVYCDKPLARTAPEAKELADLAAGSPRVCQMTFNYRFVPAVLRAVQLIDAGFLGELFSFRAAYLHAGYINPRRPYSWRTNCARSGGGAIMDLGAHVIDLIRFLLDRPAVPRAGEIAEVSAGLQTVIRERMDTRSTVMRTVDVDDIALVNCRLVGGAVGTIEASRLATGVQDELRFELHGSRGSLRFNLMEADWLDAYDASLPEAPLGGDGATGALSALRATRSPTHWARPRTR